MNPFVTIGALLITPVGFALRGRRAGIEASIGNRPELSSTTDAAITLTSTSFRPDGPIPLRHAANLVGDNVSPQLAWTRPPVQTKALLVTMEDIDVPGKVPVIHLAALLDPTLRAVAEGELNRRKTAPGVRLLDARGYQGPLSLPGHGEHHYIFNLFALDESFSQGSLQRVVESAATHVIAHGQLTGTFRLS